jgi:hypothetical protein
MPSMAGQWKQRLAGAAGLVASVLVWTAVGGCQLAGVIAASEERYGSHTVEAEYTGLFGKSYAVVAWVDRSMQAEYPELVPTTIQRVDLRLAAESGASGHIAGDQVTSFLANTPQWVAWPRARLAEELDVDRVVFIEFNEFRTNEPGNEHLWDGLAWATLSVIERGGGWTDAEAFRKDIRVTFPDATGYGPEDFGKLAVQSTLLQRVVERAAWAFYQHEEPNAIEY